MSTNSELTKEGWTLVQFLETIAENSGMGHDTNFDPNRWFLIHMWKPFAPKPWHTLYVNLGLSFSDHTDAWFVNIFSIFIENTGVIATSSKILRCTEVLTHHAKRFAESIDLDNPGSDLWRIHSPANLEALIREYENLARINGRLSVFSLYPQEKDK